MIHQRHRRTDGQTDRRADYMQLQDRALHYSASRGKKYLPDRNSYVFYVTLNFDVSIKSFRIIRSALKCSRLSVFISLRKKENVYRRFMKIMCTFVTVWQHLGIIGSMPELHL